MMRLLVRAEKSHSFWFLLGTSFLFFLLRLPSLFEPYWYGDEGIYQAIGLAMSQGRLLYRDIWDNKPPLLYSLYSLLGSDQFTIRLVSIGIGIVTIIAFYFLAKKLFNNHAISFWITFIFAVLFGLPVFEGNIANAENFMLFFVITAGIILLYEEERIIPRLRATINLPRKLRANGFIPLSIAGFLVSVAFLFKIVAIFDLAAFVLFMGIMSFKQSRSIYTLITKLFSLGVGFSMPILLTVLFFAYQGAFASLISAAFIQNVGYVGYGNTFIIPQGFLILKLIILLAIVVTLFIRRHKITDTGLFVLLWFSFSVFNAFFSQRPYTHYVLVLLPAFCLLIGLTFWQKTYRWVIILVFITMVVVLKSFWTYDKPIAYYKTFYKFVMGTMSVNEYRSFFDPLTLTDYAFVDYLNTHKGPHDTLFVWGNEAQLYKLTNMLPPGRYTVLYHMTSTKATLSETAKAYYAKPPTFVVISNVANFIPFSLQGYKERARFGRGVIYELIH